MQTPTIEPADRVEPAALHAAFTLAFSDYLIGPFSLSPTQWPSFMARQAVSLGSSRVVCRGSEVLAFALVAPRPDVSRWRLATMGAVPAARGSGVAQALLDDFVARAALAGQRAVELEVFAQNERAVRLYRSRGFEPRHELLGYRWPAGTAAAQGSGDHDAVREVGREQAFAWLADTQALLPGLPLQVTPPVLAALPNALQCWQYGQAQLVFSIAAARSAVVHSLADRQPGQLDAEHLVRALLARHGADGIEVPQLQRPDVGGEALARAGFERQALHQLLMQRDCCEGAARC